MYNLLVLVLVACCAEQATGKQVGHGRKDPCDDYYCANGGVCILEEHEHSQSSGDIESSEDRNSSEDRQSDEDRHSGGHRQFVPTCQCTGDWKGDRCDDDPCKDVNCNTGTCLFDDNGKPHCCCPPEISGEFCENEVVCPQLESPTNGQVTVKDTTVGSTATYTCDTDVTYALCIHDSLTCSKDGKWDKEPPICVGKIGYYSYLVSYGNSKYYFSAASGSINSAQAFCENGGGNLLSINSHEEWEFINCVLSQFTTDENRFIGLTINDGTWEWTSGQPVTVTYWSPAPTDSDTCMVIGGGNWIPYSGKICSSLKKFICEFNKA